MKLRFHFLGSTFCKFVGNNGRGNFLCEGKITGRKKTSGWEMREQVLRWERKDNCVKEWMLVGKISCWCEVSCV